MKIKSILSQGAFWQINKELTKKIGVETALVLSDLIDRESYFDGRNMLIDINGEGYFFVTGEQLEESTTLSYHKQRKCLKTLKEKGMIKTFLRGIPAKTHYKIVENKIWEALETSSKGISEPVVKEFKNLELKNSITINNNKEIIIENNNINNNKQKAKVYFEDPKLNNLFIDFLDLRKSLKAKNTDLAIGILLKKLEGFSTETRIEMIEQSIEGSWKRLFPIKKQFNNEKPSLAKKYFPEMFEVKGDPFETNLKLE